MFSRCSVRHAPRTEFLVNKTSPAIAIDRHREHPLAAYTEGKKTNGRSRSLTEARRHYPLEAPCNDYRDRSRLRILNYESRSRSISRFRTW